MVVSPLPDAYPVAMGVALAFKQRGERHASLSPIAVRVRLPRERGTRR